MQLVHSAAQTDRVKHILHFDPNSSTRGGVMVKAMVCEIVAHEFELQSRYYVHFRTNTLGKGMNHLTLSAMG